MSGIEARPTLGKLQNPNKDLRDRHFLTGQRIGPSRRGLDVISMGVYVIADLVVEAGSDDNLVKITAHGARSGDFFRINTSASGIKEYEVSVDEIIDANSFRLGTVLSASLTAGDSVTVLRPVLPRHNASGSAYVITDPSALYFRKNGALQEVVEDTATPANNQPLPVKLMGVNGTLQLTADNLDISSDFNEDSMAIGDPVSGKKLSINANDEVKTHDEDALAKLTSLESLITTLNDYVDGLETALSTLNAKDFATQTTLAQAKTDLDSLVTLITATNTYVDGLEGLLTTLNAKDFATQTTLAALKSAVDALAKLTDTQPVSAASLPLPTGAATAANQTTANTSLANIDGDLGAPGDAAVTNPASSASIIAALKGIITLITATNTKLDTIDNNSSPALNSVSSLTTAATAQTINAPASAVGMIIQNSTESGDSIRFTNSGATPTASVGFFLGPGQSTSYMPAGSIKVISVGGAGIDVSVIWFV